VTLRQIDEPACCLVTSRRWFAGAAVAVHQAVWGAGEAGELAALWGSLPNAGRGRSQNRYRPHRVDLHPPVIGV